MTAGHPSIMTLISQPAGKFFDETGQTASVRMNVLAGDVRYILLKSISVFIENNATLVLLRSRTNRLAPRNSPSSSGMLKRGSLYLGSNSVLEMSWMP